MTDHSDSNRSFSKARKPFTPTGKRASPASSPASQARGESQTRGSQTRGSQTRSSYQGQSGSQARSGSEGRAFQQRDSVPPPKTTGRPVLRVDMGAVKSNYRALEALIAKKSGRPVSLGACVKADAYGLGMGTIAKAYYGLGCRVFFVSNPNEGRLLREVVGKTPSIYVFNGPSEAEMQIFFGSKLKPVLNSMEQVKLWLAHIGKHEFQPRSAIHIDTGMNRLGFSAAEITELASNNTLQKKLDIDLVMSHLACAPNAKDPMNAGQLAAFKKLAASLPPTALSLANSAGIYLGRDYHFNIVRPGAALYGLQATSNPAQEVTRSVVTLAAPILQNRMHPKGTPLGYNSTYKTPRKSRILTVSAGYADGVPVALSGKGYAMLSGQKLPIVGRVSMDLTLLDATDFKGHIRLGMQAEFLGDQLEAQCAAMGGLNYEMLTRLGNRFRREYV